MLSTILYTVWLVVAALAWLFLLFLARRDIRKAIKPKVTNMDELGSHVEHVVVMVLGFPLVAISWPLVLPVFFLMLGIGLLWDSHIKPYMNKVLFPQKTDDEPMLPDGGGPGHVVIYGGTPTGGDLVVGGGTGGTGNQTPEESSGNKANGQQDPPEEDLDKDSSDVKEDT